MYPSDTKTPVTPRAWGSGFYLCLLSKNTSSMTHYGCVYTCSSVLLVLLVRTKKEMIHLVLFRLVFSVIFFILNLCKLTEHLNKLDAGINVLFGLLLCQHSETTDPFSTHQKSTCLVQAQRQSVKEVIEKELRSFFWLTAQNTGSFLDMSKVQLDLLFW